MSFKCYLEKISNSYKKINFIETLFNKRLNILRATLKISNVGKQQEMYYQQFLFLAVPMWSFCKSNLYYQVLNQYNLNNIYIYKFCKNVPKFNLLKENKQNEK